MSKLGFQEDHDITGENWDFERDHNDITGVICVLDWIIMASQ